MELKEIQGKIETLYGLNKNLIRELEKNPDWKKDARIKDIVLLLDEAANSYYRAHIVSSKLDA